MSCYFCGSRDINTLTTSSKMGGACVCFKCRKELLPTDTISTSTYNPIDDVTEDDIFDHHNADEYI